MLEPAPPSPSAVGERRAGAQESGRAGSGEQQAASRRAERRERRAPWRGLLQQGGGVQLTTRRRRTVGTQSSRQSRPPARSPSTRGCCSPPGPQINIPGLGVFVWAGTLTLQFRVGLRSVLTCSSNTPRSSGSAGSFAACRSSSSSWSTSASIAGKLASRTRVVSNSEASHHGRLSSPGTNHDGSCHSSTRRVLAYSCGRD